MVCGVVRVGLKHHAKTALSVEKVVKFFWLFCADFELGEGQRPKSQQVMATS